MGSRSTTKGTRAEREIVQILSRRLGSPFYRTAGDRSSLFIARANGGVGVYSGDIDCLRSGFRFCPEIKAGYDADLFTLKPVVQIDQFLSQARRQAEASGRLPLLLYKRDRHPWIAGLLRSSLAAEPEHAMLYQDWMFVPLETLLSYPEYFFFETKKLY